MQYFNPNIYFNLLLRQDKKYKYLKYYKLGNLMAFILSHESYNNYLQFYKVERYVKLVLLQFKCINLVQLVRSI